MPDHATAASPLHLVVMGVAGSGKSLVGAQLAERLALPLLEGDDFHPSATIDKIAHDVAPSDTDRVEWTRRLAQELAARPQGAILSCPALTREDREVLREAAPRLHFLHLALTPHQALERMASRTDQFYPPSVAAADFDRLQDPAPEPRVHAVDATQHVDRIVDDALRWLGGNRLATGSA